MNSLQKVAIFLFIIGFEKASSILGLMDNNEIKMIVPEIQKLITVSQETQQSTWAEFEELGYKENMKSSEALSVIRLLFNGSSMSDKVRRNSFR